MDSKRRYLNIFLGPNSGSGNLRFPEPLPFWACKVAKKFITSNKGGDKVAKKFITSNKGGDKVAKKFITSNKGGVRGTVGSLSHTHSFFYIFLHRYSV